MQDLLAQKRGGLVLTIPVDILIALLYYDFRG